MKIQEQIIKWFNAEDYKGRNEVIQTLKNLAIDLDIELKNTCSQCLECFEDCSCENK